MIGIPPFLQVLGTSPFLLAQATSAVADDLRWIAWAETATAVGTVILALMGIALGVAGFYTLRAVVRVLRSLEKMVERLAPKAEPLLEQANRVTEDAAEVSRRVRQNIDEVNDTVEDLNRQLREAIEKAEARVRRFGTVLDTVQEEVEDVLLDAAAAARGVQVAAEALRAPRTDRSGIERRAGD